MEATPQELEEAIYDLVFNDKQNTFQEVDTSQLQKFRVRLVQNLETRLSAQFGASMGLVEETFSIASHELVKLFIRSQEFLDYREDVTNTAEDNEHTFEHCFLAFLLHSFGSSENFSKELEDIFILELSAGLKT